MRTGYVADGRGGAGFELDGSAHHGLADDALLPTPYRTLSVPAVIKDGIFIPTPAPGRISRFFMRGMGISRRYLMICRILRRWCKLDSGWAGGLSGMDAAGNLLEPGRILLIRCIGRAIAHEGGLSAVAALLPRLGGEVARGICRGGGVVGAA